MPSRDGFSRADIDTGLAYDRKVRELVKRQGNSARTLQTLMLYTFAVLESWSEDEPMLVTEAAPIWHVGPVDAEVADLIAVGLLDRDGRVPVGPLGRWMAPAKSRSEAGRIAAEARWRKANGKPSHNDGNATPNARPTSPTGEGGRARPREAGRGAPSRAGEIVESFRELVPPPPGHRGTHD